MNEIIKNIKIKVDDIVLMARFISGSRELSLAITEANRTHNWLGRYQLKIGDEQTFESSYAVHDDYRENTSRKWRLSYLIGYVGAVIEEVQNYLDAGGSAETEIYIAITALTDSMMWLENALANPPAKTLSNEDMQALKTQVSAKVEPLPVPPMPEPAQSASVTFYDALKECIINKKRIARHNWNIGLTHVYAHEFNTNKVATPFLMRKLPNGGDVPWQPDQVDMFAKDWVVFN